LLIQKLRSNAVMNKVQISQQDVTQFLESRSLRNQKNREYHLLHILIEVPAGAGSKTVQNMRQRIENLRHKAVSGQVAFSDLAIANSNAPNALQGGDLGWIGSAFMPKLYTDIVPKRSPGEVSQVFRNAKGFHLLKLVDVRGSQSLSRQ